MPHLIGVDIGTSGTKTLLLDETGRVIARAARDYPLHSPKPLWAEQDPADWWGSVCATLKEVFSVSGVSADSITGIGLSGQMHGAVFLGDGDEVLRPAILWNDQRTQSECDWITETVGSERVADLICNPVLTGFTAGKIVWLRNHEPELYAHVRKVLLPKDYIRLKLTSEFASEVSDASGTALFDVRKRAWSQEMLDGCRIPLDWMPRVYESPEISGLVTESAAALTGLRSGTPVVGGGGDQAAGAVGNGIVETGIVSSTVGTSGVVFAFCDEPVVDPRLRLHTFCHAVPGKWHIMGVMLSAGGSLQWFRDTFCERQSAVSASLGNDPYEIITAEAAEAPAGCEGLIYLPYLTGERTPYPDPNARGVFFGITRRCKHNWFARAVMEGVAFGLRDSFEIMREMNVPMTQVRASGGGARSDVWRQIQADVTGLAHSKLSVDEGPALGAALLAGVGAGTYSTVEEACRTVIRIESETHPRVESRDLYESLYDVYRGLYRSLRPHFDEVAAIAG
jgi:xylulokinase